MKNKIQNARFDESETDHLIAAYGAKISPEKWNDLQSFLTGQKEQFTEIEREREMNLRPRPGRGH
jgi:hypothetical protein